MEYPRNSKPEYFADHIGNLTVELTLAAAEISSLIVHVPPTLEVLEILQDVAPFISSNPEGIKSFKNTIIID